jgi:hypothetical protein
MVCWVGFCPAGLENDATRCCGTLMPLSGHNAIKTNSQGKPWAIVFTARWAADPTHPHPKCQSPNRRPIGPADTAPKHIT